MPVKILCLVGRSGSGKTTVLEQWLPYLRSLGYRVAVVKHSHHSLPEEPPEKDSVRLGATVLATPNGLRVFDLEWTEMAEWLAGRHDLVLVEGGKSSPFPKIEVLRGHPPLVPITELLATLGDEVAGLPNLHWDDPAGWTRYWRATEA